MRRYAIVVVESEGEILALGEIQPRLVNGLLVHHRETGELGTVTDHDFRGYGRVTVNGKSSPAFEWRPVTLDWEERNGGTVKINGPRD